VNVTELLEIKLLVYCPVHTTTMIWSRKSKHRKSPCTKIFNSIPSITEVY